MSISKQIFGKTSTWCHNPVPNDEMKFYLDGWDTRRDSRPNLQFGNAYSDFFSVGLDMNQYLGC